MTCCGQRMRWAMSRGESVSTFYDEWYRKHGKGMRNIRAYQQFRDLIKLQPGNRVLDVSCGGGDLLSPCSHRCEAHGIDMSGVAIQLASKTAPSAHLVLGDGQSLPYADESFDVVFNIGSLEHYPSMQDGIKEIARVLKPHGIACVVVPNSEFVYYRFTGRKGTQQQAIGERLLSLSEWLNLLTDFSFR